MAINPDYWRKARDEAPIHVQIRLDRRPSPGNSIISGPIVRIFRDRANALQLSQEITFEVGWHQKQPPTSDRGPAKLGRQTVSLDIDWLNAARFLEAYLEPSMGKADICCPGNRRALSSKKRKSRSILQVVSQPMACW